MRREDKYARTEWERRFLLSRLPADANVTAVRTIVDRYIEGTSLRLRRQTHSAGNQVFKLTQKLPRPEGLAQQGLITTIYLTEAEYDLFATLPARLLTKTRYSMPPFGIDVFEGALVGLVTAEAEFDSEAEAAALTLPSLIAHEITHDIRFTGGRLASASRPEVETWAAEYGIALSPPH